VRLFGLGDHFRAAFQAIRRKLRRERLGLAKSQSRAELGAGLGALLVTGGSMGWMGWKAVRGLVSIGDLALFYQAFQQGLGLVRSLLGHLGQFYQNSLFLRDLFEFLALEPKVVDPRVPAAARAAGADGVVAQLPRGYDNLLGNLFEEGTELSVGEWQRIALARAFLRQAPLIIFDEPTSAMDPWAEADWLKRFRQLVAGRTALIITHRFTTAMLADAIHVMTDGRIVESGGHGELLARGGMYARGWVIQMGSQV
jgi:ABC-type multidrug transport system fused ATPase/permease subunit